MAWDSWDWYLIPITTQKRRGCSVRARQYQVNREQTLHILPPHPLQLPRRLFVLSQERRRSRVYIMNMLSSPVTGAVARLALLATVRPSTLSSLTWFLVFTFSSFFLLRVLNLLTWGAPPFVPPSGTNGATCPLSASILVCLHPSQSSGELPASCCRPEQFSFTLLTSNKAKEDLREIGRRIFYLKNTRLIRLKIEQDFMINFVFASCFTFTEMWSLCWWCRTDCLCVISCFSVISSRHYFYCSGIVLGTLHCPWASSETKQKLNFRLEAGEEIRLAPNWTNTFVPPL